MDKNIEHEMDTGFGVWGFRAQGHNGKSNGKRMENDMGTI